MLDHAMSGVAQSLPKTQAPQLMTEKPSLLENRGLRHEAHRVWVYVLRLALTPVLVCMFPSMDDAKLVHSHICKTAYV